MAAEAGTFTVELPSRAGTILCRQIAGPEKQQHLTQLPVLVFRRQLPYSYWPPNATENQQYQDITKVSLANERGPQGLKPD